MKLSNQQLGEIVDNTPAKIPQRIILNGQHVTLVPLDPDEHLDDLYQEISGPDNHSIYKYVGYGPFNDKQVFHKLLVEENKGGEPYRPVVWSLQECKSGKIMGMLGYICGETDNRAIEFGYALFSPRLQRTTAATEAFYLLIRYAIEDLGYRRLVWRCHSLNEASHRCALRLGFTYEGTFRQCWIQKGRNRDTTWFSIIDKEWPLRKKAFEKWLDSNNFDELGVQKESLPQLMKQFDEK